jgi:hypothetical protein
MTPLSFVQLVLPSEDRGDLADWGSRYVAGPAERRLAVGDLSSEGLQALSELSGADPSWWCHRLLLMYTHGRLRLEQVEPLSEGRRRRAAAKMSAANLCEVPLALYQDLEGLARRAGKPLPEYVVSVAVGAIWGSVPRGRQPDLGAAEWGSDDVSMKVWLPEEIEQMVGHLAQHFQSTNSDVVRNLLICHLVGRLGYERAVKSNAWRPVRRGRDFEVPSFSRSSGAQDALFPRSAPARRTAFIAAHGKSTEAFRFWLPQPMKSLLSELALAQDLRLSEYVRRVVAEALIGAARSSAGSLANHIRRLS